jgi:phage terminase large subunit-like protein
MKYNSEIAEQSVKIISQFKQTKGEWAGRPLDLRPWQKDIIRPLFGTLNKDGCRQYRIVYIELPRKNGKTTLAAGIAIYLTFFDGEPGAEVYSAANDRDQASLVFTEAANMIRQEPSLYPKRCRILDSTKRITVYRTRSFYRAISAEAYTKWGYNVHGLIYDELHAAPDRGLWDVLSTSTGSRRQPLIVVITTAGYDRNSLCWELHDYACKVRDGIIKDPTFLAVIYAAPQEADWTNEKVWKACNPALGDFRSLEEMRTLFRKAQENPALEMTFRRLYLNQWTSSVERWMPIDKWDACGGKIDLARLKGRPCYAGLDLSSTIDLTALSLVFPFEDGHYEILMRFWIPEEMAEQIEKRDKVPYRVWAKKGFVIFTEGNVIDYKYIEEELRKLRESFNIKEVAYDRWGAAKLVQDLTEDGFTVVPFGQGFASMSAPTKELMTLVLQKKISHGDHPVLRWNADNMVVGQDAAGNLKPDKAKATQKIDGMVATIMGLDRASRHTEEKKSIYETRGVRAF